MLLYKIKEGMFNPSTGKYYYELKPPPELNYYNNIEFQVVTLAPVTTAPVTYRFFFKYSESNSTVDIVTNTLSTTTFIQVFLPYYYPVSDKWYITVESTAQLKYLTVNLHYFATQNPYDYPELSYVEGYRYQQLVHTDIKSYTYPGEDYLFTVPPTHYLMGGIVFFGNPSNDVDVFIKIKDRKYDWINTIEDNVPAGEVYYVPFYYGSVSEDADIYLECTDNINYFINGFMVTKTSFR